MKATRAIYSLDCSRATNKRLKNKVLRIILL